MTNSNLLAWIDLEMTGLDPEKHHIIEIACLVTDSNLNIVAEGPEIAIFQDEDILSLMNEWNVKQHTSSGLVEKIKSSDISIKEAEDECLKFFQSHQLTNLIRQSFLPALLEQRFALHLL